MSWECKTQMIEYVLGFAFCGENPSVLLQERQSVSIPNLTKTWNGIGGKIEIGETPNEAVERESREETGIHGVQWEQFHTLYGDGYIIYVFWCNDPLVLEYRELEGMKLRLFNLNTTTDIGESHNFKLTRDVKSLIIRAYLDIIYRI